MPYNTSTKKSLPEYSLLVHYITPTIYLYSLLNYGKEVDGVRHKWTKAKKILEEALTND